MKGKQVHERTGDTTARQADLRRALLNVQSERVALTESFARLAVDHGPAALEALMVRLLRLQRAMAMTQDFEPDAAGTPTPMHYLRLRNPG